MSKSIVTTVVGAAAVAAAVALAPAAHADHSSVGRVVIDAQGQVRDSTEDAWSAGPWMRAGPAYQGDDPTVSIAANGTVRPADMSDHKIESRIAEPQTLHPAGAVQPCYRGETSHGPSYVGSERCQDIGE